jgi:hypothetical protein
MRKINWLNIITGMLALGILVMYLYDVPYSIPAFFALFIAYNIRKYPFKKKIN